MSAAFFPTVVLLASCFSGFFAFPGAPCCRKVPTSPEYTAPPIYPKAERKLVQRTYLVADLVVPINGIHTEPPRELPQQLIDLITNSVKPASWSSTGGSGTIEYFWLGMTLVINQTAEVQEQVAALLEKLRREQDTEIVLEVRLVTLPETSVPIGPDGEQRIGYSCEFRPSGFGPVRTESCESNFSSLPGQTTLDGAQVSRLLEEVRKNCHAAVVVCPKMTLFNGQKTSLNFGDWRMRVRPVTGPDRTRVRVALEIRHTGHESKSDEPIIENTLELPDGRTAVLGGRRTITDAHGKKQCVLVTVTPRVIINQPDETASTCVISSPALINDAAEEQGPPARAEKGVSRQNRVLKELLKAYDEACAEGRTEEAEKLARAALVIDPTCFRRKP